MSTDTPPLTIGQAAAILGVSVDTVRRWADAGKLPSFRTLHGHRRFHREDVDRIKTAAVA